jgi:hypothetical protein
MVTKKHGSLIKYKAYFIIASIGRCLWIKTEKKQLKLQHPISRMDITAQRVFSWRCRIWHMEKKPDIATGFEAGIGRRGSVGDAVTGGIIAINLKYGRMKAEED